LFCHDFLFWPGEVFGGSLSFVAGLYSVWEFGVRRNRDSGLASRKTQTDKRGSPKSDALLQMVPGRGKSGAWKGEEGVTVGDRGRCGKE
jgi:hypothetical protein